MQKNSKLDNPGTELSMLCKTLESVRTTFDFSSHELNRIFRTTKSVDFSEPLEKTLNGLNVNSWQEMTMLLCDIEISLRSIFRANADVKAECQSWLQYTRLGSENLTARQMLLTGEFAKAYIVVDAARTFCRPA